MGLRRKSSGPQGRQKGLRVIRERVAGIDLGSKEHWVCCPRRETGEVVLRGFATTTPDLECLGDWLEAEQIESVAMESTGVYWIPLYELLESRGFEVVLVNARQLKHVPGRKSDVVDCQWIQLLHRCGLLRGSFRPAEAICQLRALERERAALVGLATQAVQMIQKALDQMNVQVHRAVTDLTGQTGMAMVRAIVAGERDPLRLAEFRDRRCRKSKAEMAAHLTGNWRDEHLFNLAKALEWYDFVQRQLADYDEEIGRVLSRLEAHERADQEPGPHPQPTKQRALNKRGEQQRRTSLWRMTGVDLTRIDGIGPDAAQVVISEVGLDLSSFPTEKHFVSWLRLSPKTAYSAGKPLRKRRQGTGSTRVANVLRMAALSLQHSRSALGAYFRHLAWRKGGGTAVFATARKLAQYLYRMLRFGQDYVDEGAEAYEARYRLKRLQSLTTTAKNMGYTLVPVEVQG
jgi:transposase